MEIDYTKVEQAIKRHFPNAVRVSEGLYLAQINPYSDLDYHFTPAEVTALWEDEGIRLQNPEDGMAFYGIGSTGYSPEGDVDIHLRIR